MEFSTYDADHDPLADINCAEGKQGGFWFSSCGIVFPTGVYAYDGDLDGVGIHWEWNNMGNQPYYVFKTMNFYLTPST